VEECSCAASGRLHAPAVLFPSKCPTVPNQRNRANPNTTINLVSQISYMFQTNIAIIRKKDKYLHSCIGVEIAGPDIC